ncbi:hypothetical protein Tco_0829866 [Tanacetum coccineum]
MSIRTQAPTPFLSEEVAERVLALPTPPPSPLSPYSSPLPQIPSPPLPIPPPISPTYVEGSLGSRAAGIRRRDTLPSPDLLYLRFTDDVVTASGTLGGLDLPQLGQSYMDMLFLRGRSRDADVLRELGYGFREHGMNFEDEIIYSQLDDARYDRALLRARVNMLESDSPFHRRTAVLMEEEARLSRAAWAQSMDACDQTHSEGILLRTTVMTQQSEIVELRAADQGGQDSDF